jgi:hypothetical protein
VRSGGRAGLRSAGRTGWCGRVAWSAQEGNEVVATPGRNYTSGARGSSGLADTVCRLHLEPEPGTASQRAWPTNCWPLTPRLALVSLSQDLFQGPNLGGPRMRAGHAAWPAPKVSAPGHCAKPGRAAARSQQDRRRRTACPLPNQGRPPGTGPGPGTGTGTGTGRPISLRRNHDQCHMGCRTTPSKGGCYAALPAVLPEDQLRLGQGRQPSTRFHRNRVRPRKGRQ